MKNNKKIHVKIVEVKDIHGNKNITAMLDVGYYFDVDNGSDDEINLFKNMYFDIVSKANKLFYGNEKIGKKYQNIPSSVYWKLGTILKEFNDKIENKFVITNYVLSLHRDIDLSSDYFSDILSISSMFEKHEIIDDVPFSYYRALKRKSKDLNILGLFDKEKKRLNKMGKNKQLPGRENYKQQLNDILEKN